MNEFCGATRRAARFFPKRRAQASRRFAPSTIRVARRLLFTAADIAAGGDGYETRRDPRPDERAGLRPQQQGEVRLRQAAARRDPGRLLFRRRAQRLAADRGCRPYGARPDRLRRLVPGTIAARAPAAPTLYRFGHDDRSVAKWTSSWDAAKSVSSAPSSSGRELSTRRRCSSTTPACPASTATTSMRSPKAAAERFGVPVVPVDCAGFYGNKNLGNRIAGDVIYKHVIGTREPDPAPASAERAGITDARRQSDRRMERRRRVLERRAAVRRTRTAHPLHLLRRFAFPRGADHAPRASQYGGVLQGHAACRAQAAGRIRHPLLRGQLLRRRRHLAGVPRFRAAARRRRSQRSHGSD